jgi:uncharacterized membrane protein
MIKKIKNLILSNVTVLSLMISALLPIPIAMGMASADCSAGGIASNVASGAAAAANGNVDCTSTNLTNSQKDITTLAQQVVQIFSIVVGAISIIMIIYGGFRYITSGGDSNRVGSAKNTLIYAIIGLIIVALAQLIVHFVLSTTSNSTNNIGT